MDGIYLDNNATTPLLPAVREAMQPYLSGAFGNPASAHGFGRKARQALEDSRELVAALLDAEPDEVIFTSGATEANNFALFGLAGKLPGHILVSPIEHPSVAEPVRRLAELGFAVDRLPVDPLGRVPADSMLSLLRPETGLISIQLANHETGVVQAIRELAVTVRRSGCEKLSSPSSGEEGIVHLSSVGREVSGMRRFGCTFHCDATQAVGKIPVHFHDLGVTSLSLSAHKFHGPKGVGALLVRRESRLEPLLRGGHQQQGRRPGTEPVALVVGLAVALDLACRQMHERHDRVLALRRRFLTQLRDLAAPVVVNGPDEGMPGFALPHTLNLSFAGCRADVLLMNLDLAGIACSTGSACSSGSLLPSPVLQAMAVPADRLASAMRFSLSSLLSDQDIDEAVRRIAAVCCRLRQWSSGLATSGNRPGV
jgi:cysteine desulfurase